MGNFAQGEFVPKNPQKYIGKIPIIYRSSWELTAFNLLDRHPSIMGWAYESIEMPYLNPVTKRWSIYVPDLIVLLVDKDGNKRAEMIEIKPLKETLTEHAKTKRDKMVQAINLAKWSAAIGWCKKRGFHFRVMTENQLFGVPKKR